jgi:hypothetical protein
METEAWTGIGMEGNLWMETSVWPERLWWSNVPGRLVPADTGKGTRGKPRVRTLVRDHRRESLKHTVDREEREGDLWMEMSVRPERLWSNVPGRLVPANTGKGTRGKPRVQTLVRDHRRESLKRTMDKEKRGGNPVDGNVSVA